MTAETITVRPGLVIAPPLTRHGSAGYPRTARLWLARNTIRRRCQYSPYHGKRVIQPGEIYAVSAVSWRCLDCVRSWDWVGTQPRITNGRLTHYITPAGFIIEYHEQTGPRPCQPGIRGIVQDGG